LIGTAACLVYMYLVCLLIRCVVAGDSLWLFLRFRLICNPPMNHLHETMRSFKQ
jgi:hypothetical protein